jgi:hypothetical protein
VQPTFQVPWERLEKARRDFLAGTQGRDITSRSFLFLCGVKLACSYAAAWHAKHPRAQQPYPCHLLDDGLEMVCQSFFKELLKTVRSRRMSAEIRDIKKLAGYPSDAAEWLALEFSFLRLNEERLPPRIAAWVKNGDCAVNWTRLSFGAGVCSLYDFPDFVLKLRRNRFNFIDRNSKNVTQEVVAIAARFDWDPAWVLPEI